MRIGIDLGGTKIEAIALSDSGEIVSQIRVATPNDNYPETLQCIVKLIAEIEQQAAESCTVGVGTPGSISPATGLIRNANSTCLNGKPLKEDLEKFLKREIRLANDANCFALSEATDGAGYQLDSVFGVIIGTGTGGGIVVDGKLVGGINAIAGEWGHNPLPWPTTEEQQTRCYCGKQGCIETFLSGPGLKNDYQVNTDTILSPEKIVALANQKDVPASNCLNRYIDRLARSLALA
jgi:fructokinase